MNQTKICTKCHIEKPITEFYKEKRRKYGVRSDCKICKTNYHQDWVESNRQRVNFLQRKYAKTDKGIITHQKAAKKYSANEKGKLVLLNASKKYRSSDKGKSLSVKASAKRRAIKAKVGGSFTTDDILKLFELQSRKCVYCKVELSLTKNNKFHIDHIMPLSKGGTNDISNIQLLCPHCNLTKNDKLPEEFAAKFGKLL